MRQGTTRWIRWAPGVLAALLPLGISAAPGVPEVRSLANGLQVVFLEDHTLPLLASSLWVHAGSKHEIESSAGYAHFLEHLVQRGTKTVGPFEFQRLATRRGGTLSVRSNYDRTSITLTGVPSALDDLLGALSAMAFQSALDEKQIDLELGTLSQEIRNYYNLPSSVAFLETMRHTFPEHPYRFPMLGNYKTVGTLKSEPLTAFYRNLYVPNNMTLAIAGDVDPKRAWPLVEAAFGKAKPSATLPPAPPLPTRFAGHTDVEKRLEIREAWVNLSFAGPGYRHPDRAAFEVIARALADANGSPLHTAMAHGRTGIASYVSYYGLEDGGMLYLGLQPASPEQSYDAARSALEGLVTFKSEGLKESGLRSVVEGILQEDRVRAEQLQERAERLGEAALLGGVRYYWDLPGVYAALTPESIARVAAKYLVAENMRLVIILPKDAPKFADATKDKVHEVLERLGRAAEGSTPDYSAVRYPPSEAARVSPAAWGDPRGAARFKAPEKTVLDNGLTLIVQEDHRHGMAAASVQVRAGSGDDPPGKEGLANLTLRLLARDAVAHARRSGAKGDASLPAAPSIQLTRDLTEIRFQALPRALGPGLATIAAALRQEAPAAEVLDEVRKSALDTLERGDPGASSVALELFREQVYSGHPYAGPLTGTPSGIKAITRDDMAKFRGRHLRPSRTVVAVAGDVEPSDIVRQVKALLGDWKDGAESEDPSEEPRGKPATAGARAGDFTRMAPSPQGEVLVGVPGVAVRDADFGDIRLLGTALTLEAFDDLVFTRRAAFSAVAVPEGLRAGGFLAIEVVTPPHRLDDAVFELQRLMRVRSLEPLGAKELTDVGRVQAGRDAAGLQGVLALAGVLSYREASGLGALTYRKDIDEPPKPVAARIKDLAARLLKPEAWIVIKVGPGSP